MTLVIRAQKAILPEGERSVAVIVDGEVITGIEPFDAECPGMREIVLSDDEVLLPGLVDSHVHVNEPGRTSWEGYETATSAAREGGITTIIDMPLNSTPPTTTLSSLKAKQEATKGKLSVDVGFWAGAVPENSEEMSALWEQGVFGFKCFTAHSGIDEFGYLTYAQIRAAMTKLREFDGVLIVHAEDPAILATAPAARGRRFEDFLRSRPREAENRAIEEIIRIADELDARVHILHLASADALPMIREAKARGVRITVETCPHYLTFASELVPDGATEYKCAPPLREEQNRRQLWAGLLDGTIDHIASDHSPCIAELKNLDTGDFGTAWGGISSVQLGFPAVWTAGQEFGVTLNDIVKWFACAPAMNFRIRGKGAIVVGNDADFAIVSPDEEFEVDAQLLEHRNKISPYHGRRLRGVVRKTLLRGVPLGTSERKGTLIVRGQRVNKAVSS